MVIEFDVKNFEEQWKHRNFRNRVLRNSNHAVVVNVVVIIYQSAVERNTRLRNRNYNCVSMVDGII